MIRYVLQCSKDHSFEAHFRDSAAYGVQRKKRQIACPICNDTSIRKAPMAPSIADGSGNSHPPKQETDVDRVAKALHALKDHVEANSENVGRAFPEEARKIHYGDGAPKSIYGEANLAEARELRKEGVPCVPLPWPGRRGD